MFLKKLKKTKLFTFLGTVKKALYSKCSEKSLKYYGIKGFWIYKLVVHM